MTTEHVSSTPPDFYDIGNQLVCDFWDENFHQGYWLSEDDASSNRVAADRMTDLLIERSGLRPGERMLDLGCGIGLPAFRVAEAASVEIIGISNNRKQIDEAADRAARRGLADRVSFQHADALALPFPDDSFDVVWSLETLPHLDRPAAFREIRRVLRPGGRFIVTDLLLTAPLSEASEALMRRFLNGMQGSPMLLDGEYRELVRASGLELVELRDISEHTRKTPRRVTEAVNERFDEMVQRYGEEIIELLETFRSPFGKLPEMGYLMAFGRNAG